MNEATTHIERLTVHLQNLGVPFLVFLILAAAACAIWYYRSTVPPVTGMTKQLLISLRTAALVLLVIGLAEPVLKIARTVTREAGSAVLFDTSSSMDQLLDPSRKRDALDALNTIISRFGEHCVYRVFDSSIRSLEPEIAFDGSGTDIFGALKSISEQEDISSIILISDGRWNFGRDPAGLELPADMPVNSIAVGSVAEQPDVVLKRISSASIGYDGTEIPVEIFVSSAKPLNAPLKVEILEHQRTVASGTASPAGGTVTKVGLELPLKVPGEHIFTAVVFPGHDEPVENNMRSFAVQVVKSAFRVLVIADAPSPDLAFIRRVILSDDSFEGIFVVGSGLKEPFNDPYPVDLSLFDAFLVIDGGGLAITPERAQAIARQVSGGDGLWILGSTPPSKGAAELERIVPVSFSKDKKGEFSELYMELTEKGRSHFITAGVRTADRGSKWNDLPPLNSIAPVARVASSGTVLVNAVAPQGRGSLPAVVTGRHGDGKTVVMPFSGIWRWHLMMEGAGRSNGFFPGFVLGTLRWLTSGTDYSPLTVTTDSRTYLSGEEIMFEARLFDNVYAPVSGAEISLVIDDDPSSRVILEERAPAVYSGILRGAAPGEHIFKSQAYVGGDLFAVSSGSFSVDEFSLEMLNSAPDYDLLGSLAARTGGISVTPSGIDSILALIKPRISSERLEEDHYIALNPIMPLLAVLLFAFEWGIRKHRGMI